MPLQLLAGGGLVVEQVPGATAYNVYVDQLGSYYSPTVAEGTFCTLTGWIDNGDGTLTLPVWVPDNAWVVVSATNAAGESSVGKDGQVQRNNTIATYARKQTIHIYSAT